MFSWEVGPTSLMSPNQRFSCQGIIGIFRTINQKFLKVLQPAMYTLVRYGKTV